MNPNPLDEQKVERFAEKMTGVLNYGALALMCSIGYRTRLFDIMAQIPPATSEQVAEAAGLNERYVREWLRAMFAGGIIEYEPRLGTYHLPPEHTTLTTRDAGANNLTLYTQHIGGLAGVEDQIVECFSNGGGVPYAAFPRFHEVMAEDSGVNIVEPLIEKILPVVPGLLQKLEQGIQVLDVGCGRGLALQRLAQTFPNSHFFGFDFSDEAITVAQAETGKMGLSNLRFAVEDAAAFNESDRYDLITTFDAVHDQAYPARVLRNIARALKPGGDYLMQDIAASSHVQHNLDHPLASFLYTLSTMHCMTVSLAYGGEGLGTMWGKEKALEMLAEAGFAHTEVHQLPHDIFNYYYVSTK